MSEKCEHSYEWDEKAKCLVCIKCKDKFKTRAEKEMVMGVKGLTHQKVQKAYNAGVGFSLLDEAKHSLATLMVITGNPNVALPVLMKWPDALEAHLTGKREVFIRDMGIIMCAPIKIIAEALAAGPGNDPSAKDERLLKEISDTFKAFQDGKCGPIETKNNLIRLCNTIIFKLRQKGHTTTEYIKPLGGEK